MYVVKSSDKVVFTRDGGISLKQFSASGFQHTKKTWEVMGINKGCLPNIVYVDPVTGVEYEAYMTMNGLEVDPETEEYKRMIATLTSFPASMVHEAMQVANDIYKEYFEGEERDYNKSPQTIFEVIEKIQNVLIALQNTLFLHRQEIKKVVQDQLAKIPTSRQEAMDMKDILQLHIAMLEKAECKPTRSGDQEMVDEIVRNHVAGFRHATYPNLAEKYEVTDVINETRKAREAGDEVELDKFLELIVKAFQEGEGDHDGATLQAALMADSHPQIDNQSDYRPRNGSGGAQRNNRPTQVADQALRPHQDGETQLLSVILKTLHDMKSDIGMLKKKMNVHEEPKKAHTGGANHKTKSGWRAEEQKEKIKSRFAGAMERPRVKQPKQSVVTSRPQPLTSRVVSVEESDSDAEQSADFAGVMQQQLASYLDYRVLTMDNNAIVLGTKCIRSFEKSPQHINDRSTDERSVFGFTSDERTMRNADPFRYRMTSSLLSEVQMQQIETVVKMDTIGGQEEVVHLSNDQDRIQVQRIQMTGTPPPAAACPWMDYQPQTPECQVRSPLATPMRYPSPCAPQVENYALDAIPNPSKLEQGPVMMELQELQHQTEQLVQAPMEKLTTPVPRVTRPRTRSVARSERFVIPTSLELSDSDNEKNGQARTISFTKIPFGAPRSMVDMAKKVAGLAPTSQRVPLATKNINATSAEPIIRCNRSTPALTTTTRSKKQRTTRITPPPAPKLGDDDEDSDASSGRGPPELISTSSENDDV